MIDGQTATSKSVGRRPRRRAAALAAELAALPVDVIVTGNNFVTAAAKAATSTIPIVMVAPGSGARGLIDSLARPGGNITGLTVTFPELGPKRLELLKEAMPALERWALVLAPQELPDLGASVEEMHAAPRLGCSFGCTWSKCDPLRISSPPSRRAAPRRCRGAARFATNTIVSHGGRRSPRWRRAPLRACSEFGR